MTVGTSRFPSHHYPQQIPKGENNSYGPTNPIPAGKTFDPKRTQALTNFVGLVNLKE